MSASKSFGNTPQKTTQINEAIADQKPNVYRLFADDVTGKPYSLKDSILVDWLLVVGGF